LVSESTFPRTCPVLASIRWIVGSETPASRARVRWSMPSNARAARICAAVIIASPQPSDMLVDVLNIIKTV
jgi:hypothetical protein